MSQNIFHDGKDLVAYAALDGSDYLVLSFAPWSVHPLGKASAATARGFGNGAFSKRGLGEVHVVPRANHWYQTNEIFDVLEYISELYAGKKILCYGASMGGQAAIVASSILDAPFLALAPQYTIDRQIVPSERRWAKEASEITFNSKLLPDGKGPGGYLFYDPFTPADRLHGQRLAELYPKSVIQCPFSGHSITAHVQSVYGLPRLVKHMLEGTFSIDSFHEARRKGRGNDPIYLANLVSTCIRRRKWKLVERYEQHLLEHPKLKVREIVKLAYAYNRVQDQDRAVQLCSLCVDRKAVTSVDLMILGKATRAFGADTLTDKLHQRSVSLWPHNTMLTDFFDTPAIPEAHRVRPVA